MSALFVGLLCTASVALGGWLARKRVARDEARDAAPKLTRRYLEGFPCQFGDIVMRKDGSEAWLQSGFVFSEEIAVSALFTASSELGETSIYVRREPANDVLWLTAVRPEVIDAAREAPALFESDGTMFERLRRTPLRVERWGASAPELEGTAFVSEYLGPGGRRMLLVQCAPFADLVFAGVVLTPDAFEVLPAPLGSKLL